MKTRRVNIIFESPCMSKGKPKKLGKQAKREGIDQAVEDFCEESFDGETNNDRLEI